MAGEPATFRADFPVVNFPVSFPIHFTAFVLANG
jgi:hypothetical protein